MNYYPNVNALEKARNDFAASQAAMAAIKKAAGDREVVLPALTGGFLPHVIKASGVPALPPDEFREAARAAFETRERAREKRAAVQDGRCQRMGMAPVRFGSDQPVDFAAAAAKRAEAEAKRAARRAEDTALRNRMRGRGSSGGDGKKGGKKKAA